MRCCDTDRDAERPLYRELMRVKARICQSLVAEERRPYCVLAQMYGAEIEAVSLDVPADVCRERNRARSRHVPEDIMDKMAAKIQPPTEDEGFRAP